jgi:hypothetical protein
MSRPLSELSLSPHVQGRIHIGSEFWRKVPEIGRRQRRCRVGEHYGCNISGFIGICLSTPSLQIETKHLFLREFLNAAVCGSGRCKAWVLWNVGVEAEEAQGVHAAHGVGCPQPDMEKQVDQDESDQEAGAGTPIHRPASPPAPTATAAHDGLHNWHRLGFRSRESRSNVRCGGTAQCLTAR